MNLPNSLVRSMKAKLSHRIRKSSHVRTIKIDPRIAYITAPAQKSSFSEKYCTLVQTSAEKTYAIQNENQKTLSLLPYSKPAAYSNLAKNHPPSLRRYRDRQRSSLHSDRQLSDTKHALAGMDGRVCASQVAEQSMQHPAKGRQKARPYIEADLLDCPNRIACLLPYPSCPATTKKQTSSTERVGGRRYDFGNLRISSTQLQKRTRDRTSDGRGALPLRAHKQLSRL